jgi:hypothetical protein
MMALKGMPADAFCIFKTQAGDGEWSRFAERFMCLRLQICHLPDKGRVHSEVRIIQNLTEINTPLDADV